MGFMTYLVRRGAQFHFRYRLPEDLRDRAVPRHWPQNLKELVSAKTGRLKHEIMKSLATTDQSVAKVRLAARLGAVELLVKEARQFIQDGPSKTLSEEVVAWLAESFVTRQLANDDALREKGIGLRFPMPHNSLLQIEGAPPPPPEPVKPGLTEDDLDLLTLAVDSRAEELRRAVAMRKPPESVRYAVRAALEERGIELAEGSPEMDALDLTFLNAAQRANDALKKRNDGKFVVTPAFVADPAERQGPRLSEAFELWRTGRLVPGMNVPGISTVTEAEYSVRRFRELHGDPRVGAITREQARQYRDAMWRLPTRLPKPLEGLPLRALLSRGEIVMYPQRASGTLAKHLTLIKAIVSKTAKAHDFKYQGAGWSNPFDGLSPEKGAETPRDPYTAEELAVVFGSAIYTRRHRPKGGQGEAAFWVPLLGLLTGARLGELAQLRLQDVKRDAAGVDYIDINDEDGKDLKTKTSKRLVPLHPALIEIGFLDFVTQRRAENAVDALLFDGMERRGKRRQPGERWSKWFNRWRRDVLQIKGINARKDFHSFRHTFKDMCREAGVHEEVHDALTGHAFAGVGRRYGAGVPLSKKAEAVRRVTVPEAVRSLVWSLS